ncbi:hypothetical protein [Streptomyces platensis]|uniref:hypothetical protein n=1 Tax=Streptomyces platensis TaxID=58346 RepID=UPI002E125B96|nr:hypothetical protein OG229_17570 [Streptomyces platensis]
MMKKTIVGLVVAGAALVGASPASAAFESYSPGSRAGSWTQKNDTQVAAKIHKLGTKAHADYYRTTDPGSYYTLWNKKSTLGSVTYSGVGGRVTDLRTCNWVPDNDDECSRWEIRG